jgi:lysophospholipase L1-like esterase
MLPRLQLFVAAVLLSAGVARADVLAGDFSADPRTSAGWTYTGPANTGWSAEEGGSITAAFDRAGGGQAWRSPPFPVVPAGYYRVAFRSQAASPGYAATLFAGPAGTWGSVPNSTELLADDVTGVPVSTAWVDNAYCFRAAPNATTASLVFRANGAPLRVSAVRVVPAARGSAEVADWHDAVYATMAPVAFAPDPARFARLPRTAAALRSGGPITVVLLGDSIMNDAAQSTFETLLERAHPGTQVAVVAAVGANAGMAAWNPDAATHRPGLDLQGAVIDRRPDLVLIGGVSNAGQYADTGHVVDLVRRGVTARFGFAPDVALLTGTLPMTQNPAAPIHSWYPTISPAGRDYRANLYRLAQQQQTGFFDLTGAWGQYMVAAQHGFDRPTYNGYFRDTMHFNTRGKEVLARILAGYLSPEPER